MNHKQAKAELKQIMSQKTVSISRLEKVLSVLDYENLGQKYADASKKIKRQKDRLRYLEMRDSNGNHNRRCPQN